MLKKICLATLVLISTSVYGNVVLSESNTVSIINQIDMSTVVKAQVELQKSCAANFEDKYLVLYSPGGSIMAGRLFIDYVQSLPCKVHTITIFAASMAYQIVQHLGTRYIIPSGTLMSHRASISGLDGQLPGELFTRLAYYTKFIDELDVITAKRTKYNNVGDYKAAIHDELWLTATEAVNTGHADKIDIIECDSTLDGTKTEEVRTLFGNVEIVVSKCPMILGPLEIKDANSEKMEAIEQFFNPMFSKVK